MLLIGNITWMVYPEYDLMRNQFNSLSLKKSLQKKTILYLIFRKWIKS
jgi:hypothetical protein